jgi:recombinational DNA repair ATPase RecF
VSKWSIESLEIAGGFLSGLSLRLPAGLTCIIGARGSGKSTLAEAIRYAIGTPNLSKSSKDLIQANLSEAIITLSVSRKDETSYLIRRSFRQAPILCTANGQQVQGVDLERGTFFPLDAYSSNEIEAIADETLGDKRRVLIDELRATEFSNIALRVANYRRDLDANRDSIRSVRRYLLIL